MNAIVIGSGIAGLAAAIRMAGMGIQVDVFEANSYAGGKLYSFEQDGYRFDGGPSLFTMPSYLDELFQSVSENPRDWFNYRKLECSCHYFWEDGARLTAWSSPDRLAEEASRQFGLDKNRLLSYFHKIGNSYRHAAGIFLEKSLHRLDTWLNKDSFLSFLQMGNTDILRSLHNVNASALEEPHMVQFFDRFATYNGSDPYRAPGILNVVPWLEHGIGTFYPVGGMISIPRSLEALAKKLGVRFHFNKRVNKIITKNGRAVGVESGGVVYTADIIVSNMDVYYTYRQLLADQPAPENLLKQERSSSALVFYWGVKGPFRDLGLHNILFSSDYRNEFNSLFTEQKIADDFTVYINISSKEDAGDAPENCENWFVMVNAPNAIGGKDGFVLADIRKRLIDKINRILKVDMNDWIQTERYWTPSQIEADTLSYTGALYGSSSNSKLAAFLRHSNSSSSIQSLYFCGGTVHPGGGIPLCLLSAKIATDFIKRDYGL